MSEPEIPPNLEYRPPQRSLSGYLLPLTIGGVIIVAAVFFYRNPAPQSRSENAGVPPVATPSWPTPIPAEKGELVSGFPEELILDVNADLDFSGVIPDAENRQETREARFTSDVSASKLAGAYRDFFKVNETRWNLISESNLGDMVNFYAADKISFIEAFITIEPLANGKSRVLLSARYPQPS